MAYKTQVVRTFQEWYEIADNQVQAIAGVSIDDLPDGPSRSSYDNGMSPISYARLVLKESGF